MKIADLHEDIAYASKTGGFQPEYNKNLILNFEEDIKGRHADIPKYIKGNVRLIFDAVFPALNTFSEIESKRLDELYGDWKVPLIPHISNFEEIVDQVLIYRHLIKRYKDKLMLINKQKDIEILDKNGKIGILISLEGLDALKKSEDVEILYLLGIRSVALTWNYDNKFASSCTSKKDYGLTKAGEDLIEICNDLGIIVDVSHASKNSALEATNISKLPIIASHSNYYKIKNHNRNLDDEVLEGIKRTKGVIGFTFITSTIGEKADVNELSKHIIAVWENFDSDILALGTDFFGISKTPEGLEDVSKIPSLIENLKNKGLSDNDIEKLCWKNVYRVISEHERRWKEEI
jgi:membrane dipeptidase